MRKKLSKVKLLILKFLNGKRQVFSSYTLDDLLSIKEISISELFNNYEYLKYICDDAVINYTILSTRGIKELIRMCEFLKKYNKNNRIEIAVSSLIEDEFKKFILSDKLDYENILVFDYLKSFSITLDDIKKNDKVLDDIVKPAKALSDFEKFIYAYNITKMFKEYNENKSLLEVSRYLDLILNNEYIVCVGFVELFLELLRKLDIRAEYLSVDVGSKKYNIKNGQLFIEEEKEEYHARVFLYLKDKKYDIDGYYISDPTFDNCLCEDYYSHLLFTIEENKFGKYDIYNYDLHFLDIKSREELYKKMEKYKEDNSKILDFLEKIDKEFINKLKTKYGYNYEILLKNTKLNCLTDDIADRIISKNNNPISGKTIFKAIREIYKLFYGYKENELNKVLEQVREINKSGFSMAFSKAFIDEKVVVNSYNKFDFELDKNEIQLDKGNVKKLELIKKENP